MSSDLQRAKGGMLKDSSVSLIPNTPLEIDEDPINLPSLVFIDFPPASPPLRVQRSCNIN
jgi:hypothetical protein